MKTHYPTGGGVVFARKYDLVEEKWTGVYLQTNRDIISTVNPKPGHCLNGKEVLYKLKEREPLYLVIAIIILMLLQWKRQYRKLYQYIINTRKEFIKPSSINIPTFLQL